MGIIPSFILLNLTKQAIPDTHCDGILNTFAALSWIPTTNLARWPATLRLDATSMSSSHYCRYLGTVEGKLFMPRCCVCMRIQACFSS